MNYLILIASDETANPRPGSPEFDTWMADWTLYNQRLVDSGHFVAGAGLMPTTTATTVRKAGGTTEVVDGPFAETKEQLGGFYVVTATNLDEALALAEEIPLSVCSLEVRPLSVLVNM
jgi:hypothetical protein